MVRNTFTKVSGQKKFLSEILFHKANITKWALKVSTDVKILCQILFTNFFQVFWTRKVSQWTILGSQILLGHILRCLYVKKSIWGTNCMSLDTFGNFIMLNSSTNRRNSQISWAEVKCNDRRIRPVAVRLWGRSPSRRLSQSLTGTWTSRREWSVGVKGIWEFLHTLIKSSNPNLLKRPPVYLKKRAEPARFFYTIPFNSWYNLLA